MFNRLFLKNIFKLWRTKLPTDLLCWYIPKNWKRITANVNTTVNSSMKSVRWYIPESWKRKSANVTVTVNSLMELYMFLLSMLCQIVPRKLLTEWNNIFFFVHDLSIKPFINLLTTDLPTDQKLLMSVFPKNILYPWSRW